MQAAPGNGYDVPVDEYNPEQEMESWDTPESPPPFEKKSFGQPVEYHDTSQHDNDHRSSILPSVVTIDLGELST